MISALIVITATAAFLGGMRICFIAGLKVGAEQASTAHRRKIHRDMYTFYSWFREAPEYQTVELRKTEVEAIISGMNRAAELI